MSSAIGSTLLMKPAAEIANLADGYQEAGRFTVTWNATHKTGIQVSSGVYFARLRVTDDLGMVKFTKTSRLLLMK